MVNIFYICCMLINELSKKSGFSIHTIRYYEKYGLIKGERNASLKPNNYFHYSDETVEKLLLIHDAKSIGFTLAEIKQLLNAWYGKKITLNRKLSILDSKMADIDEKIERLKSMKKLIIAFKEDVMKGEC